MFLERSQGKVGNIAQANSLKNSNKCIGTQFCFCHPALEESGAVRERAVKEQPVFGQKNNRRLIPGNSLSRSSVNQEPLNATLSWTAALHIPVIYFATRRDAARTTHPSELCTDAGEGEISRVHSTNSHPLPRSANDTRAHQASRQKG